MRLFRFGLSAVVALMPALALAAEPQPPRPIGSPGLWVTDADYPTEALRRGAQGVTGFRLEIDTIGRVSDCHVTSSSGSELLDGLTCNLLAQRARFTVARDEKGRPAAGTYLSSVRWQIPDGGEPPVESDLVLTFTVGVDGVPTGCRLEALRGPAMSRDLSNVGPCARTVRFHPYRDASGAPVAGRVRQRMTVEIDPSP